MRDFALVAFIVASLPVGMFVPFYALLVYAWISYMYPQMYAWSFAQYFPSAKLMAGAAVLGILIRRDVDLAPVRRPETIAMILLLVCFTISTVFAVYPVDAWERWQDVSKLIVMALVASVLLTTQQRMRYFLLVVAFYLGFYGIKGCLFRLANGGE